MSAFYPEPLDVAQLVEDYVSGELAQAEQYTNRHPLDDSGIYALHRLAADVYARGWKAGHIAGTQEQHQARRREKDRA